MSLLSDKLKKLAELNFCEGCYSKYLILIQGEIEYLLSEPMSDWRQAEENIDVMWIKAKGFYRIVNSTIFAPDRNAFQKARAEKLWKKLKFLKEKGILQEHTYKFLDKVSKKRNKIHPPSKFSKQDYVLFLDAKRITDAIFLPIIHELKNGLWKNHQSNVEKHAKVLLLKSKFTQK